MLCGEWQVSGLSLHSFPRETSLQPGCFKTCQPCHHHPPSSAQDTNPPPATERSYGTPNELPANRKTAPASWETRDKTTALTPNPGCPGPCTWQEEAAKSSFGNGNNTCRPSKTSYGFGYLLFHLLSKICSDAFFNV